MSEDILPRLREVAETYSAYEKIALGKIIGKAGDEINRLRAALRELHATVIGECPSLLDEDSGGSARLALEIEDLLGI